MKTTGPLTILPVLLLLSLCQTKQLSRADRQKCLRNLRVLDGRSPRDLEDLRKLRSDAEGGANEHRLYKWLMRDYTPDLRPVKDGSKSVTVHFGLALLEVTSLQEDTGLASLRAWLQMWWTDDFLRWDANKYKVNKLEMPASKVWLPDIQLLNGVESDVDREGRVAVLSDGKVLWNTPASFAMSCKHEFRGNSWTCPFKFASWAYDGRKLDMQPYGNTNGDKTNKVDIEMGDYISSDHWLVLGHSGDRKEHYYECCPNEPAISMHFSLKLRNTIGPSLLGKK